MAQDNIGKDSLVIVNEQAYDYAFIKKNGKMEVHKKYIADNGWINIPGGLIVVIIIIAFCLGMVFGSLIR